MTTTLGRRAGFSPASASAGPRVRVRSDGRRALRDTFIRDSSARSGAFDAVRASAGGSRDSNESFPADVGEVGAAQLGALGVVKPGLHRQPLAGLQVHGEGDFLVPGGDGP